MQPISLAQSYASSTYLPPFTTTLPMEVPQFGTTRRFYKPYGRGLGAAPTVARADPTIGLMDQITMGLGQVIEEGGGGGGFAPTTYFRPWTSLRKSAGPLLGLGQEVFVADMEWWAKAAGTAALVFASLYILAKL